MLTKNKGQQDPPGGDSGRSQKARVTIPYIAGLSDRVKKHIKAYGISTSFKPINTLRGKLVHVKDKQPKDKCSNLVYGAVCSEDNCKAAYVGETKQALKSKIYQHRRPSTNEAQNSAIFLHTRETGHSFNNKDFQLLDKEEQWYRRGIKEAIWERVEQPSLNKKGGLRHNLSHVWDSALKRIPSRLSHDHNSGSVACRSPEVPDAT